MSYSQFGQNYQKPAPDVEQESTGPVAKDSLAAESIRDGGEFARNENAEPLGVRGDQSTLNTTDTSGASTLRSAPDAVTRERQEFQGLGSDERGHTGVKYPDADAPGSEGRFGEFGSGNETSRGEGRTTGGAFSGNTSSFDPDLVSSSAVRDVESDQAAPNYVGTVTGDIHQKGLFNPKGRDLVEDENLGSGNTRTGNVGGQYDPGRLAEREFEKRNAEGLVESGDKQFRGDQGQQGEDENPYDALRSSERA